MQRLLDFSKSFDCGLLDNIMEVMASPTSSQKDRRDAQEALMHFKNHPQAYSRADVILETAKNPQSKFYALGILQDLTSQRWKSVPDAQESWHQELHCQFGH